MSVLTKQRIDYPHQNVDAALKTMLPFSGSKFAPSSLGRPSIAAQSPFRPAPRSQAESRDVSSGSGDETDDLFMEGIDDSRKDPSKAAPGSPALDAGSVRAEGNPELALANLAQMYLPAVFAEHGPCAIRHLKQYLAVNNASFGALPQGTQQRLIVKALEYKKGILFEKVGWGRWNFIEAKGSSNEAAFTPETKPYTYHRRNGSLSSNSLKQNIASMTASRHSGHESFPAMSSYSSHQDFMFSPALSPSLATQVEDDVDIDPLDLDIDDGNSETDEEDWKSLGAEALRSRPTPGSALGSYREPTVYLNGHTGAQRSSPYPIRRKSSAGVYQIKSPSSQIHSYSKSPTFARPSFPKSSSYLRSSPMSNIRESSFSRAREDRTSDQVSPTRADAGTWQRNERRSSKADAVEALVMLSSTIDERQDR